MGWKIHFGLEFGSPESILIRRWGKWDTSSAQLLGISRSRAAFLSPSYKSSPILLLLWLCRAASDLLKTKLRERSGVGREGQAERPDAARRLILGGIFVLALKARWCPVEFCERGAGGPALCLCFCFCLLRALGMPCHQVFILVATS